MTRAPSGPEELTFAERVTARCPACGMRVQRTRGCRMHGRLLAASEAPSPPFASEIPSLPGYRIGRVIGRGGFGTVFATERLVDGQRAALKIARRDGLDAGPRLRREIEALTVIGPPHVPAVYDAGTLGDGTPYVAMAHLDAKTLADRLVESAGPVVASEFGLLARSILRALAVVHARGYVHRDLKPENIFIDDRFAATLIDFGLVVSSAARSVPAFTPHLTCERARLGTAEYMAPEQGEGRPDIDARADIYAMGVILYELLSGHPPFWGAPAVVQEGHRNRRPPSLTAAGRATPALEDVVLRCLAKARDDRFASALELDLAIERALLASAPRSPRPPSSPGPLGRSVRPVYDGG